MSSGLWGTIVFTSIGKYRICNRQLHKLPSVSCLRPKLTAQSRSISTSAATTEWPAPTN